MRNTAYIKKIFFLIQFILFQLSLLKAASPEGTAAYNEKDWYKAYNILLPEAKAGDEVAQYYIADILIYKSGFNSDWWNSVPEFKKIKKYDKRVKVMDEQGIEWLRKSAWKDYTPALVMLGKYFVNGSGGARDHTQGAQWLLRAANQGDAEAQSWIGTLYHSGKGIEKNDAKAVEWWERSAKQGYSEAMRNLFKYYAYTGGEERSDAKAAEWIKKSASFGNPEAYETLGYLYSVGEKGFPKDIDKSIESYLKAGTSYGQTRVEKLRAEQAEEREKAAIPTMSGSLAFDKGEEFYSNKEYDKAIPYIKRSAEAGNSKGQFRYGYMYMKGFGVPIDYALSMKWYKLAAAQGHTMAMNNIGVLYEDGLGVKQNITEARSWYNKAKGKGNEKAKENLARLDAAAKPQSTTPAQRPQNNTTMASNNSQRSTSSQNSGTAPKTTRTDLGNGNYIEYTFNPDGSMTSKTVNTCIICHGSGVCGICGGAGSTYNRAVNMVYPCSGCLQSGRCKYCQGQGKSVVLSRVDSQGNGYAIGQDGTVGFTGGGSSNSSNSSSSSNSRSSNSGTCDRCEGIGVDKFPVYINDPAGAGTHAVGMVGYTHSNGGKCQYCGKYAWHIHTKCTKCGYR